MRQGGKQSLSLDMKSISNYYVFRFGMRKDINA